MLRTCISKNEGERQEEGEISDISEQKKYLVINCSDYSDCLWFLVSEYKLCFMYLGKVKLPYIHVDIHTHTHIYIRVFGTYESGEIRCKRWGGAEGAEGGKGEGGRGKGYPLT